MPHVVLTPSAIRGMERCRRILQEKSSISSKRAMDAVRRHYAMLRLSPNIGRPINETLKELVIPFGDSGYLALYRYEADDDTVYVIAFRHQKEADY